MNNNNNENIIEQKPSKRRQDLVGKKFGHLTVIEMLYGYRRKKSGQSTTYCRCICDCGNEVIRQAYKLKSSKTPSCGCASQETAKKNTAQRHKDLIGKKFNRLTILGFVENDKYIKVHCKCECGNDIVVNKNDVVSGHTKSCGCLHKEAIAKSNTKNFTGLQNDFGVKIIEQTSKNHKGLWKWKCQCSCGNYFEALPGEVMSNHVRSCGCMKYSSWEKMIILYLQEHNISYKTSITFDDCKDKGLLMFDFGVYDNNGNLLFLIEYDGEQHFKPLEFFGGEKDYQDRKRRDNIKNQYCKDKGIILYRIPYYLDLEEVIAELDKISLNIKNA